MDFDPQAYLDLPTNEANTRRNPVPAGDYVSTIQNIEARTWQSKDKYDERTGQLKSGIVFDITHTVDLPESVQTLCGIKSLTIRDGVMVDRSESGAIDTAPGKNSRLRAYRDALDMNKPGEPFRARDMLGKLIRVRVTHEEWQGNIVEKIGAVARV
jgi:hypothetical protein